MKSRSLSIPRIKKTDSRHIKLIVFLVIFLAALAIITFAFFAQNSFNNADCNREENVDKCYVGLSEAEAVNRADKIAQDYRIVERDGVGIFHTFDTRPNRVNLTIDKAKVTKAELY